MSLSTLYSTVSPVLRFDFANKKQLDPRISFTRNSTATYYDGQTTAKAEENLFVYSQEFNNSAWIKQGVNVTINADTAPDGTSTANKITPTTVLSQFKELQQNFSTEINQNYSFSIFAKAAGYQYVQLIGTSAQFGTFAINFDLNSGTETQYSAGTSTIVSREITSFGNGWYRVSVVATALASGTNAARLACNVIPTSTSSRGVSWSGDGTSGVYLWGAQLEQRSSVSSYTATTTQPITNYISVLLTAPANVARFDHNPNTNVSLGLLIEGSRTNLSTYSEQFNNASWDKTNVTIITDTMVAPNGTLTSDLFLPTATGGLSSQSCGTKDASAITYTMSIYAKAYGLTSLRCYLHGSSNQNRGEATFNLSAGTVGSIFSVGNFTNTSAAITAVGNNWYRCSVTTTSDTTTGLRAVLRFDGTTNGFSGIHIWGAQVEAGSASTSYIPTVASAVTRNADNAEMSGLNFASWYNFGEGVICWEYNKTTASASVGGGRIFASGVSGSNSYGIWSNIGTPTQDQMMIRDASGDAVSNVLFAAPVDTLNKIAAGYQVNNFAVASNNVIVITDTSGVSPTQSNQIRFGRAINTDGSYLNSTIRRFSYYNTRLTNAQIQALTSS